MRQLIQDFAGNVAGDFSLDNQNILQVAIIGFTPDQGMVADLKQLRSNRYPLSRNANATFENVVGMDVFADTIEVTRGISGAQADDPHLIRMELPKPGDHFFGQTVSDKVLGGIATQVLERPDRKNDPGFGKPDGVADLVPENAQQ